MLLVFFDSLHLSPRVVVVVVVAAAAAAAAAASGLLLLLLVCYCWWCWFVVAVAGRGSLLLLLMVVRCCWWWFVVAGGLCCLILLNFAFLLFPFFSVYFFPSSSSSGAAAATAAAAAAAAATLFRHRTSSTDLSFLKSCPRVCGQRNTLSQRHAETTTNIPIAAFHLHHPGTATLGHFPSNAWCFARSVRQCSDFAKHHTRNSISKIGVSRFQGFTELLAPGG